MAEESNVNTNTVQNGSAETVADANTGGNSVGSDSLMHLSQEQFDKLTAERIDRAKKKLLGELQSEGVLLSKEEVELKRQVESDAAKAREEEAKKAGRYKELYEATQAEIRKREEQLNATKTELEQRLDSQRMDLEVERALWGKGVRTGIGLDKIKRLISEEGQFKVDDGKVLVVGRDGNPRYSKKQGSGGEYMSVDEAVVEWLDANDWALDPVHKGGSGTNTTRQGEFKLPPNHQKDPTWFQNLSPDKKAIALEQMGYMGNQKTGFTFERQKKTE